MEPKKREKNTTGRPIDDDLLIDYALGEVDPEDRVRVDLLLAENPELMREARALKRLASHMGVSMVAPPPRLASRVRNAAYEARPRRSGWRLVVDALRRPITATAAGLVAVALLVALLTPSLWHEPNGEPGLRPIVSPATTMPADLRIFLQENEQELLRLQRGEPLDPERFSVEAGNAMILAEKDGLTAAQHAVLQDVKTVWEYGHVRVNSVGYLSDGIVMEMKDLAAKKRLIERIDGLLDEAAR